jgi:hypothetical protein
VEGVERIDDWRRIASGGGAMLEQLTTTLGDVINSNMKAVPLMRERISLDDDCFVELVIWKLPEPRAGSAHDFKYRLALVSKGLCVMRYDNELGKGDHKHVGETEADYAFISLEQLQRDFWIDVEQWRKP